MRGFLHTNMSPVEQPDLRPQTAKNPNIRLPVVDFSSPSKESPNLFVELRRGRV
jgi:hypothetical protein